LATQVSLKVWLTFWYSAIVALSLSAFGAYTYLSVSKNLHDNLDVSLIKVVNSLDYIISENQITNKNAINAKLNRVGKDKFAIFRESERSRFVGPLRPSLEAQIMESEKQDAVWSSVYEHILLNPRNYFIQIADTNNDVIWRSRNLLTDSLPVLADFKKVTKKDTLSVKPQDRDSIIKLTYDDKGSTDKLDSVFTYYNLQKQQVRLLVKKTQHAIISVGYSMSDIQSNLNELFAIQILAFPLVLLLSVIGGLVLSRLAMRTVDQITMAADEISEKNLSLRIPEVNTKDEIGHLVRTFNSMISRLEKSFSQIKRFTSDASHELKTPLTILRGELELALRSDKNMEQYQDIILSALEEVVRLTNVVETLLELSKAEAGQIKMNFEKINLSRLIIDITEDAEILAESKNIKVTKNIQDDIYVFVDSARIHQAALNIIDNAVKYTPQGGEIKIELTNNQNYAYLTVSDTGVGIPEDELKHIFDRFYRVDKSRSASTHGAGLGLSIVKWIVDAHNGQIEVKSILDEGSTFVIKLPVKKSENNS